MAKVYSMSWEPSTRRWAKEYKGKPYRISCKQLGCEPTKEASWRLANKWWAQKQEELEAPAQRMAELAKLISDTPLTVVLPQTTPKQGRSWSSGLPTQVWHFEPADSEAPSITTVGKAVGIFLANALTMVRQPGDKQSKDTISAGRYSNLKRTLTHFANVIGATTDVRDIKGFHVEAYNKVLRDRIANGWSKDYARIYAIAAKQFIKWAWGVELLDSLPRNLNAKSLTITVEPKKVPTLSNDEVKTLLDSANERLRLFILLCLNCGMTQKDISDLHPSEIDWDNGILTRKRSKTASKDSVPTVSYPLWPETFVLLKKLGSKRGEHVLLTANGTPLVKEALAEGKVNKSDCVKMSYNRLCRKLGIVGKPLKLLRKTSSTRIYDNPKFSRHHQLFLGHAPTTIAEKSYIGKTENSFETAIKWLASEYGLQP